LDETQARLPIIFFAKITLAIIGESLRIFKKERFIFMANNKTKKQRNYNPRKDAHRLSTAQIVGTLITTSLLANYYWQAAKYVNPRFANDVEYKKKQLKKKAKATVDHLFGRTVDVEDKED
jgi:hypothetical protein